MLVGLWPRKGLVLGLDPSFGIWTYELDVGILGFAVLHEGANTATQLCAEVLFATLSVLTLNIEPSGLVVTLPVP